MSLGDADSDRFVLMAGAAFFVVFGLAFVAFMIWRKKDLERRRNSL